MSDGRTVWWSKDAAWWRREWIVALGLEFGAAGPAVIDWLWCEAKAQNDAGWVKTGPHSIARGCFVDAEMVSHVLSRSVTLGLLDEYSDERGRLSCRLSGYRSDQERAQATERKAKQRARESGNKGDLAAESRFVTPSHAESRSVPKCPPTGQDRTVHTSSLRSEVTRKRATRRVDQSKLPDDFPDELLSAVDAVQPILIRCWDQRGGIEPGRRGTGLAVLRNPRADHEQIALKLEYWLLAGKGQKARCGDVASRFGDWVQGEGAAAQPGDGMSELDRRRLASAMRLAGGAA